MASNDYHFVTRWRVAATPEEVTAILSDAPDLVRWWPSVYLSIAPVAAADAAGLGGSFDLYTKGWLPYTLRWRMTIVATDPPRGFGLEASGDFVGRGEWTFTPSEGGTDITYDWRIRADKALLRSFSFIMKPIFGRNHEWAMARGLESLRLELDRRHAASPEARAALPPPPGPTPVGTAAWLAWLLRGGR